MNTSAIIKALVTDVETIRRMRRARCYNKSQITPLIRARDYKIYQLVHLCELPIKMVAGFTEISYVSVHGIVKKYVKIQACEGSTK